MTLHQTILDECLNEIRTRLKQEKGSVFTESEIDMMVSHSGGYVNEASLLAMEKQAEFYEWASREWWHEGTLKRWFHCDDRKRLKNKTTEELYEIWEGQNHE